ncbi:lisH domain-containing protein C1711.05 [Hyalella azteca]|uniref:LisH domain-containing protein C1711.05 n=1 Tax=Hyalella azteca TaxID=294128 RepID=A0A8B7N146_HYAAZ|nr:lisH domain-containing protein C1711.05 [Hyalella azteca]
MFSATSLEAQKLISVSIGKMNASRVTRTGASLHKSLLVATVLHKARNVYFEEERERVAKIAPVEVTVTPVCHLNNPHLNVNTLNSRDNKENSRSECREDEVAIPECVSEQSKLPLAEANTDYNVTHTTNTTTTVTSVTNSSTVTTTSLSQSSRKRRRVSDQETAAAVSSILPKRLRSELKVESFASNRPIDATKSFPNDALQASSIEFNNNDTALMEETSLIKTSIEISIACGDLHSRLEANPETESAERPAGSSERKSSRSSSSSSEDSDSDDDASSDTSNNCEEMEVDQLTSLVSYFSFSQSQKQSEFCLSPIHPTGPHTVALTA